MSDYEKHEMKVPNWIWHRGKHHFHMDNPAGEFRNILGEAAGAWDAVSQPFPVAVGSAVRGDKGKIIFSRFLCQCSATGVIIEEGEQMLIRNGEYFCLDYIRQETAARRSLDLK